MIIHSLKFRIVRHCSDQMLTELKCKQREHSGYFVSYSISTFEITWKQKLICDQMNEQAMILALGSFVYTCINIYKKEQI